MRRLFAFSILFTIFVAATFADLPFRNHRYDSFKVLPITSEDIVFIGNSITNMNEWWEAFGSNHNVKNRGVSGAYTDEALAEAVKKVFDCRPSAIIRELKLTETKYYDLAAYGHMGREELGVRWEDTDKVDALLEAVK